MTKHKVFLIVRDGWGFSENKEGNAIAAAKTPFDDHLNKNYKPVLLKAHGPAVGLPEGFQGSSEVGHMNMGAGQIVIQEVTRINNMLETGEFYQSRKFRELLSLVKNNQTGIHLMGLLQDEGVHAHQQHLFLLMQYFFKNFPENKIYIHVFADGRDTPPKSTRIFIKQLEEQLTDQPNGMLATVTGRYYSMDRSNNYDLITTGYDAICSAKGDRFHDIHQTIEECYQNQKTPDNQPMFDEYLKPLIHTDYTGVNEGDILINFNYRQDRAIQMTKAFTEPGTPIKSPFVKNLHYYGFTQYYNEFDHYFVDPLSSGDSAPVLVGKVIADAGLKQLRISETQKFRHVTSFFNGKSTKPFPLEDQVEIPSQFDPSSFATHPEMNANEITEEVLKRLEQDYAFVLTNYANCDMVGHTGEFDSAVKGAEIVDRNVEIVAKRAMELGYEVLITADHGNSEEMLDIQTSEVKTSHTLNPVNLHLFSKKYGLVLQSGEGILSDISTLVLRLMDLPVPDVMNARHIELIEK